MLELRATEDVMSKTILAILEQGRFPEAVTRRAAQIAKLYDCKLDLVLSDPTIGLLRNRYMISGDSKQIADNVRLAQQEELERLASTVSGQGLEVQTDIIKDRPASDAIIARALETQPLFVVKGTEYHSPAERARITFGDWQLIRKLDYPLWLVKPDDWDEHPVIIAAVDPMHPHDEQNLLTRAIIDLAKSVADKAAGKLLLLHTYESMEEVSEYAKFAFKPLKVPVAELEGKMRDEHQARLASLAATEDIDTAAVNLLPGRTREILPAFARSHNASVVVMGAVARTGLKRRMIGSTAEHVIDHVPCDILIARG
jgi:universal stress protein E